MRVDRLNKLADFLDTVPNENFDMGWWVRNGRWRSLTPQFHACKTAACAMGWAAVIPEFRAEGLHWERSSGIDFANHDALMSFEGEENDPRSIGAKFFDIPLDDAGMLFGASSRNPREQAQLIRDYIKSKPECEALFNEERPDLHGSDRRIEADH